MTLPIIGITMGDPTGIGPEIIVNSAENSGSRPNFTFSISFRKQVSSIRKLAQSIKTKIGR